MPKGRGFTVLLVKMIYVSPEYMKAVTAPEKVMDVTINFNIADVTAKDDINNITANSNEQNNLPWRSVDGVYDCLPYGTCEQDQFGTSGFYLIPYYDLFDKSEWGWSSSNLSDNNGKFAENPKITYYFSTPHSSLGVTLYLGNPVKELRICWKNKTGTEIKQYTATNLESIAAIECGVENYYSVSIEFVQIKPHQYVKLYEVDFGMRYTYTKEQIISAEVLEEIDLLSNTLSCNTVDFTLNDIEQRFNLFNPNNKSKYLQKNQKINVISGLLVDDHYEQVSIGDFYLSNWSSPTQYSTKFTGYDLISLLEDTWFHCSFYQNATVKTILDSLFSALFFLDSSISTDTSRPRYYIHPNVQNILLSGYVEPMSYRDALQRILFSCRAVAHVDRDGILNIYRATPETRNKPIIDINTIYQQVPSCGTFFCGQSPLIHTEIQPIPNPIVIDSSLSQTPEVDVSDYYSQVQLEYYDWTLGAEREVLFEGDVYGTLYVKYSKYPAENIQVTGSIRDHVDYACASRLLDANGHIVITGYVYEAKKQVYTKALDSNNGKTLSVNGVTFIGNQTTAENIADWLLESLQNRITQKFKWWCNPALEVSDYIKLENQYGNISNVQVTKNTLTYSGGWQEESEAVTIVDTA